MESARGRRALGAGRPATAPTCGGCRCGDIAGRAARLALALRRWEEIKQAARDEIRSGYRASRAVEDGGGPWERARFAAVRTELMETFRPRNGVEQMLVDQLAQASRLMEGA